jgi:hypothetical protein
MNKFLRNPPPPSNEPALGSAFLTAVVLLTKAVDEGGSDASDQSDPSDNLQHTPEIQLTLTLPVTYGNPR